MKALVQNYTFDKDTRQITLTDYTSIDLEQILIITNVTKNVIIYNFADPNCGGFISKNVLTLAYDTSSMSNSDSLQIFIDDMEMDASRAYQRDIIELLAMLAKSTSYARDSGDRMRVVADSGYLVTYMRNSSTAMAGSTEGWYSYNSWNTVDAREQLMATSNDVLVNAMQRWSVNK